MSSSAAQRRPEHSRMTRAHLAGVGAIAVAGGVVAAIWGSPDPTGSAAVDAIERGLGVAVVALAASRARRWTLMWAAGWIAVFGGGWWWIGAALSLLAVAWLMATQRRDRVLSAGAGALLTLAAMEMPTRGPLGTTIVIAAIALGPVLWSGYRRTRRPIRRRIRFAALGLVALLGICGLAAAGLLLHDRAQIQDGISSTREGAASTRNGKTAQAVSQLGGASNSFTTVADHLELFPFSVVSLVPGVSQNLRLVTSAVEDAAKVTGAAAVAAGHVDYEALSRSNGGVDLAALDEIESPIVSLDLQASTALSDIDLGSTVWTAAPLDDKLDSLTGELSKMATETRLARLAVAQLPQILGANGTRRYFVILGSSAESRDLGGLAATWAILAANNGKIDIEEVGSPTDLISPADTTKSLPFDPEIPESFRAMEPTRWPQNWTSAWDIHTVSRAAAALIPQTGRGQIDGVMYLDPIAFRQLLTITGPIEMPSIATTLTNENALRFFTIDQYRIFKDSAASDSALEDLLRTAFDKLTSETLPGPKRLSELLSAAVRGGHLRFVSLHPQDRPILVASGLDPAPLADSSMIDSLGGAAGAVLTNTGPNKLDPYISVETKVNVEGVISGEAPGITRSVDVTVRLSNNLKPAEVAALPAVVTGNRHGKPSGTAEYRIGILSPDHGGTVSVNGKAVDDTEIAEGTGFRHVLSIALAPGDIAEITLTGGSTRHSARAPMFVVTSPRTDKGSNLTVTSRLHGSDADGRATRLTKNYMAGEIVRTGL